jgi:hypothetical protein
MLCLAHVLPDSSLLSVLPSICAPHLHQCMYHFLIYSLILIIFGFAFFPEGHCAHPVLTPPTCICALLYLLPHLCLLLHLHQCHMFLHDASLGPSVHAPAFISACKFIFLFPLFSLFSHSFPSTLAPSVCCLCLHQCPPVLPSGCVHSPALPLAA